MCAQPVTLEEFLVAEGAVSAAGLDRARRVQAHLDRTRPVADLLIEMGLLARAEYERLVRAHRRHLSLPRVLCEMGVLDAAEAERLERETAGDPAPSERERILATGRVTEEQYLQAVCDRHGIPFVRPETGLVDRTLLGRASLPYLVRRRAVPLHVADEIVCVACADPLDLDLAADMQRIFEMPVQLCGATAERVVEVLETIERLREGAASSGAVQVEEFVDVSNHPDTGEGATSIVDHLLTRAIQMRASDLHVEPMAEGVRVRVRVDGVLRPLTDLPAVFGPSVASRIKVMSGADIAERRLHQDGRVSLRVEGREVDVRVSSYASVFGETLVLRLLDRHRGIAPLEDIGFEPMMLADLRDHVLRASSGLVLLTGPTGSGKTTTLYSFVDYENDPSVKVITCEDPVEYVLAGVVQCSVNAKSGPTFPDSLRAIVRQDPDVIVVGEIRDGETAALAVESALTGHKVYSTFHTEDAVGAVVRLQEMGIAPFLAASTLGCIVAQRLLRRVCASCARPATPRREDLRYLGLRAADLAPYRLLEGAGCDACGGAGYAGRLGIQELLIHDDDFRDAILRHAPSRELRALARALPRFTTLEESGLLKVAAGQTTLSELAANVPHDAGVRPLAQLLAVSRGGGTP